MKPWFDFDAPVATDRYGSASFGRMQLDRNAAYQTWARGVYSYLDWWLFTSGIISTGRFSGLSFSKTKLG